MTRKTRPTKPHNASQPAASALKRGMALHHAGQLSAAQRCYETVRRREPGYGEALRLRGLIAHQQGETDTALKLLRRAVEQQPSNPVHHHTLGEMLRAAGELTPAVEAYRRAFALQPERRETGFDLAETQAQAGRTDDAIATYRALLNDNAASGRAHTRIATLLYEQGDPEAARVQLETWRRQAPQDAKVLRALGRAFATVRAPERAVPCYREALALAPDYAEACAGLGSTLQIQGQIEEGVYWQERALDLKPDTGWVYASLMANRGYEINLERREAMARLADDTAVRENERMHLHFALGVWHDNRKEHEHAFARFEKGNRIHARREPFDAAEFDARIERMVCCFTTGFFADRAGLGDPSERPLFIVGMPRSGTSLVEQIIASHPRAYGADELADIGTMVRELPAISGSGKRYPEAVGLLEKGQVKALAERYLGALDARSESAVRVTDKMPSNMLWLGLIAVLFPNARVIYCRRDAMDNCLSCYFQIFNQGLRYCYDQTHLGRVYRQHERLMAHWAECLPLRTLTVDYESLVANQEAESRRLIEFAGLPWDDRCLAFHTAQRDVHTASVWQVRQPMYASSVARWRSYEPWLGELRNSLDRG